MLELNMKKGDAPILMKSKRGNLSATASWSTNTDYDLYALILKADGKVETVATFGAHSGFLGKTKHPAQLSAMNGAVKHLGDVRREARGDAKETIEIQLTPEIRAVVPVAYSAQSNGTGSFKKYKVSLAILNGEETIRISSDNANRNNAIYTCAIGIIENTPEGVKVHALEMYSEPGSENRPTVSIGNDGQVVVTMDQGPKNDYK